MDTATKHEFVRAAFIEVGDTVFDNDKKPLRVTEVGRGVFRNSTLITTGKTWHCLHNSDLVEREARA